MKKQDWELIVKYLSGETSQEENNRMSDRMQMDKNFKKDLDEAEILFESIQKPEQKFDKERILKLINLKITLSKKQKKTKILYTSIKYAAIFIGLIIITVSIYRDLHSVKSVANNIGEPEIIILPDNTIVTLNKGAVLSYENSTIKGFNRKVSLKGEAFFEVSKNENKRFVVQTNCFDVNVLGTKFNVRNSMNDNSVVLSEGKVLLNKLKGMNKDIVLKPGEIVEYISEKNKYLQREINSEIYTTWMKNRLEFDKFSINDFAILLKVRYGKTLIIKNENAMKKRISGSAPSDDVHLIVKALRSILKTEVTEKNDTIIIN